MRLFGHYVLASRFRLFLAEQAAAGVLFLAAAVVHGPAGVRAMLLAAGSVLMLQAALYLADLYEPAPAFPRARWLVGAGVGVVLVAMLWRFAGPGRAGGLFLAAGVAVVTLILMREVALTQPRRAVVLGSGTLAWAVASVRESLLDCTIVGYLPDRQPDEGGPAPLPLLLDRGDPDAVAQRMTADLLVVATEGPLPEESLARARAAGIEVVSAAGFAARFARRLPPELLARAELVFGEGFLAHRLSDLVQRGLDIAGGLAVLLLSSPLLLLAMLAVRLDSPGPVMYRQERVGKDGRPYLITKLRSMRIDAEAEGLPKWASKNDQRITRVGRLLRKTRLDELPQIFAVLRGDMSLVGPRPERPFFVEQLQEKLPLYRLREVVRPGVTGWAQIRYPYGSTVEDARRKLEYDLYYVRHRSLFLDLTILFHTARTVLTGRGAR